MPHQSPGFIRFVTPHFNKESGYPSGLFVAAWDVRNALTTPETDRLRLKELLVWFGDNLDEPRRFWRSNSKAAQYRNWRGLSWFKDTANEHISRMYVMSEILFDYGHPTSVVHTSKPGFVVYEDNYQVVAEPFSDTPTV